MSKYTEAIESLGTIFKCHSCDMEVANCMECDFLHDTCLEALQIADRLEQAMTDEQTADCIIVDTECVNNKHDKEVWLNGYNQALADIRGDAE